MHRVIAKHEYLAVLTVRNKAFEDRKLKTWIQRKHTSLWYTYTYSIIQLPRHFLSAPSYIHQPAVPYIQPTGRTLSIQRLYSVSLHVQHSGSHLKLLVCTAELSQQSGNGTRGLHQLCQVTGWGVKILNTVHTSRHPPPAYHPSEDWGVRGTLQNIFRDDHWMSTQNATYYTDVFQTKFYLTIGHPPFQGFRIFLTLF